MKKAILLILVGIFLSPVFLYSQKKFQKLDEVDNVTISYRWKQSKMLKKDSPLALFIKIKNANEYAVKVEFTVDYFFDGMTKASSEKQNYCLKKGGAIIGRMKKSGFDSSGFTEEELFSDRFVLEVNEVEVGKVDKCK